MRFLSITVLALLVTACGGATDTSPTRYNFAVVDGRNQTSTAGAAQLAKPITAQLTQDPQGKFATRVFDFLGPAIAYAQTLSLAGTPVANAIVCGRETGPGEPKVVPLCAYTLADGKAANSVQGGTKAGTYNILFTAQVPSTAPVVDSTTATVEAGAADTLTVYPRGWLFTSGAKFSVANLVRRAADKYGNQVTVTPAIVGAGGFSALGDSVFSDATERSGDVTLSLGNRTAVTAVISVYDLRLKTWRLQGKCGPLSGVQRNTTSVDSVSFDLMSQSVTYLDFTQPLGGPIPRFTWAGPMTYYLQGGAVATDQVQTTGVNFISQAPDSLYLSSNVAAVRDKQAVTRQYVMPHTGGGCAAVAGYWGSFTISAQ